MGKTIANNKCISCGNSLNFDPESGCLKCSHCESLSIINSGKLETKNDFNSFPELKKNTNKSNMLECVNCGAKTSNDKFLTGICPYCGSSNLKELNEALSVFPDGIVPFKVSKKQAKLKYKEWIRKKRFVPNKLKNNAKLNKIEGHYFPVWDFDFNTSSKFSGVGIKEHHYSKTVHTSNGPRIINEVKITRHPFNGQRSDSFVDLLVAANDNITSYELEKLKNYGINDLKVFNTAYLLGFKTSEFAYGLKESFNVAKNIAKQEIKQNIEVSSPYDRVESLEIQTNFLNKKFNYLFLPVWICTFVFKHKDYKFLVNGYTGYVVGKVPRSALKILSLVFGILLGIALIGLGVYFLK